MKQKVVMDGNTAAAYASYAFTEVAAIYPITPSSQMAESVDEWASQGKKNLFGKPVKVRGRRCRHLPRISAGRCADHHLYGGSGTAADDPPHVPYGG